MREMEARLSIWQRQYSTPSMEELLNELDADQRNALCEVRDWLRAKLNRKPKLAYVDVVWNWCEQYTPDGPQAGGMNAVYLIPNPSGARVAVCSTRGFFERLPASSVPKSLHAGLADGVCVGELAWCSWTLSGSDDAKPLIELIGKMLDA